MSKYLESAANFETSIWAFFYRQLFTYPKPLPKSTSLDGQTVIVTGSNLGLGFEASKQLLQLGLTHLIMAVRSESKGAKAASTLQTEFPKAVIDVWHLDMDSYPSIVAFAKRCESLPRIDVAILNAGIQAQTYGLNKHTNHEQTFQVNYLSTVLLTILLLPILKMKKSTANSLPVLCIAGSDTAYWAKLEPYGSVFAQFDVPEKDFSPMEQYSKSKLALQLATTKLAEYIEVDDGVIINVANPGMCRGTSIFREGSMSIAIMSSVMGTVIGRSPQSGASNYIYAVLSAGRESHGGFVSEWGIKPFPKVMYTKEGEAITSKLWDETLEELRFANASQVLAHLHQPQE